MVGSQIFQILSSQGFIRRCDIRVCWARKEKRACLRKGERERENWVVRKMSGRDRHRGCRSGLVTGWREK